MSLAEIQAIIDNKPYDVSKTPQSYEYGCMFCGDSATTTVRMTVTGIPSLDGTPQIVCKSCGLAHNREFAMVMTLLWLM